MKDIKGKFIKCVQEKNYYLCLQYADENVEIKYDKQIYKGYRGLLEFLKNIPYSNLDITKMNISCKDNKIIRGEIECH